LLDNQPRSKTWMPNAVSLWSSDIAVSMLDEHHSRVRGWLHTNKGLTRRMKA
jgi:hypothetical protein